jgi:hypothetical protein
MKHSSRLKAALGACVLVTLAACGGGGSDSTQVAAVQGSGATGAAGNGAAGNSGQIGSDSFLAQIVAMLGTSSDTAEPGSIDSITTTSSDTTEPFSIM